jgi:predicted transcriptional regulator
MAKEEQLATEVLGEAVAEPPSNAEVLLLGPRLTEVMAEAISDEFSRLMLSTSVLQGKTVDQIREEGGIPQSTCYRRMRHLVDEGAMVIERIVVAPTGRKYAIYRSTFSRFDVKLENGVMTMYATLNPAAADKLRNAPHRPDSSRYSLQKPSPFVMHRGGGPQAVAAFPEAQKQARPLRPNSPKSGCPPR